MRVRFPRDELKKKGEPLFPFSILVDAEIIYKIGAILHCVAFAHTEWGRLPGRIIRNEVTPPLVNNTRGQFDEGNISSQHAGSSCEGVLKMCSFLGGIFSPPSGSPQVCQVHVGKECHRVVPAIMSTLLRG